MLNMKPFSNIGSRTCILFAAVVVLIAAYPAFGESTQSIITFHNEIKWEEVKAFAVGQEKYGVSAIMDLPMINALVLRIPDQITREAIANDARVLRVEDDIKLQWKGVAAKRGGSFIRRADRLEKKLYPWGILRIYGYAYDDLLGYIDKDLLPGGIELSLKDLDKYQKLRIAVFDTGLYHEHDRLKSIVKGGIDLINPVLSENGKKKGRKAAPLDNNGHGTHVAGILAAALDKDFEWGKKAKIELFVAKVLDHEATGDLSNIVMAIQWAIDNDIDIINMSIGYRQDNLALRRAIQEADKAGIVMVASSGNHSNYDDSVVLRGLADGGSGGGGSGDGGTGDGGSGDGGSGDGGSGDGGSGDGGSGDGGSGDGGSGDGGSGDGGSGDGGSGDGGVVQSLPLYSTMYPARYPEVIAVAASDFEGYLAPFSNFDDQVDIMAPGSDILSADITNGDMKEGGGFCSGTSMAAPHVTAAVTMMLALDPTLTTDDIKAILIESADYRVEATVGELDLNMALESVFNRIIEDDSSAYEKKELKKIYREKIKEKLSKSGDDLWE